MLVRFLEVPMRAWQRAMIYLARSTGAKRFMQTRRTLSQLSARFVGGKNSEDAVRTSEGLKSCGVRSSLFYLGEYVDDPAVISETVLQLKAVIDRLAHSDLDIHISVDPTQIGYQLDGKRCRDNAFEIAHSIERASSRAPRSRDLLMLDMEDSGLTESTIALYYALRAAKLPAAITLQAYLRRTGSDLRRIVSSGGAVRLVKGAFAEKADIAFTKRSDIDKNYLKLATTMLSPEAKSAGFYPVFGTHDAVLVGIIAELASELGWRTDEYEFEMLYGVQTKLQERIRQNGQRLRLYLPYGMDWWPYAVRRIGESPRNAGLLLRSIVGIRQTRGRL